MLLVMHNRNQETKVSPQPKLLDLYSMRNFMPIMMPLFFDGEILT